MPEPTSCRVLLAMLWAAATCAAGALCAQAAAPADKGQVDVQVESATISVPGDFTVRIRVTAIKPDEPTDIAWRRGGEGLGGEVFRGTLGTEVPTGQWTAPVPVNALVKGRFPDKLFLTFMAGRAGRGAKSQRGTDFSTDVEMEFEFALGGRAVKTVRESGPDGGTVGLVIPAYRLAAGVKADDPRFLDELTGILEYARRRTAMLEELPWAAMPVPKRYVILTDIGGYGEGIGYGIRTTNKAVVETECRSLRQLGVNSFRSAPPFLLEMAVRGEGYARDFGRACDIGIMGYPVPSERAKPPNPEAGCPFGTGVAALTEAGVRKALDAVFAIRLPEVWGLTVDEIGTVVDHAPEGKSHFSRCPRCGEAFRAWLRGQGLAPADFGKAEWADVKPVDLAPKEGPGFDVADKGQALAAYYTRQFNNYASARLFTPLRDACARANEAKRKALAEGRKDAPEAARPYVYSYALRGNTFLMKGHSLDFFDFYRCADNAFVYEMSNRGPQVWSWDSYLCDVGRVVSGRMGLEFGVYVKPHRGAPIQRALAAAARGTRLIYWYTYGPDYKKGDSFSQDPACLVLVSKAARLLGKAEGVLYGASWARPAEVAVVSPRASEYWMGFTGRPEYPAAWENAKWTYTALAHAHIPVDALDEAMLATEDLGRYKVIYVSGINITRAAAEKLARWVEAGGTLYTSGGGLARDEANQPLKALEPVLGLDGRRDPEMYARVALYGATSVEPLTDPRQALAPVAEGAEVVAAEIGGRFRPVVGREVLRPARDTQVMARFADGGAAVTRRTFGKGRAYVVGFFPGLEYSTAVRGESFDMPKDFDAGRCAWVTLPLAGAVRPVVHVSAPTVEGVLVKNRDSGELAVVLMNWTYAAAGKRGANHVPLKDVRLTIRGAEGATRATSVWLDKALAVEKSGEAITVTLPELAEGDVLLLE